MTTSTLEDTKQAYLAIEEAHVQATKLVKNMAAYLMLNK
jgi:hypothetical protein